MNWIDQLLCRGACIKIRSEIQIDELRISGNPLCENTDSVIFKEQECEESHADDNHDHADGRFKKQNDDTNPMSGAMITATSIAIIESNNTWI